MSDAYPCLSNQVTTVAGASSCRSARLAGAVLLFLLPAVPPVAAGPCPPPLLPQLGAECGSVAVPASRRDPSDQTVTLAYARISPAAAGAAEPILVLPGGLGMAGSRQVPDLWPALQPLHARHELIFFDQRGTGASRPSLACPGLPPAALYQHRLDAQQVEACKAPLTAAGYRTGWFNTEESALDLQDLRNALGISRWNLLATAYGAELALRVARLDPDGVTSLVLNSPAAGATSVLSTTHLAAVGAVWERIFVDCAADSDCHWAYPRLRGDFLALARLLTERPLPFRSPSGSSETLSFAALQRIMNVLAGSGRGAALAPAVYDYLGRVATGRTPADDAKLAALYLPPGSAATLENTAVGLRLSLVCREVWPSVDPDRLADASREFAAYSDIQALLAKYRLACPLWDAGEAGETPQAPMQTPHPTLLLTGDYDTRAPSYLAVDLSASLPRSRLLSFRGVGHDVFGSDNCARQAVYQFLDAPDRPPSLECLRRQTPPRFKVFDFAQ